MKRRIRIFFVKYLYKLSDLFALWFLLIAVITITYCLIESKFGNDKTTNILFLQSYWIVYASLPVVLYIRKKILGRKFSSKRGEPIVSKANTIKKQIDFYLTQKEELLRSERIRILIQLIIKDHSIIFFEEVNQNLRIFNELESYLDLKQKKKISLIIELYLSRLSQQSQKDHQNKIISERCFMPISIEGAKVIEDDIDVLIQYLSDKYLLKQTNKIAD